MNTESTQSVQSDREPAKRSRLVDDMKKLAAEELTVDIVTYLDKKVSPELALKIRNRLDTWVKKNEAIMKSVPELAGGLPKSEDIVDNKFALATIRFQRANGLKATSSVDRATYRALFPEEFRVKAPTGPAQVLQERGFMQVGRSSFYKSGDLYVDLQKDNTVRFFRNYPTTERLPASQIARIAVVHEGQMYPRDRIATVRRGMSPEARHAIVSISADRIGGVGSLASRVDFPSGSMTQQLKLAGFAEKAPSVFERNLTVGGGNVVPVTAVASPSGIYALLLPINEIGPGVSVKDIGRPTKREQPNSKGVELKVYSINTPSGPKKIATGNGKAEVTEGPEGR